MLLSILKRLHVKWRLMLVLLLHVQILKMLHLLQGLLHAKRLMERRLLLRVWVELRGLVPLDLLRSTVFIATREHVNAMAFRIPAVLTACRLRRESRVFGYQR
jgi:hypothetical protein